jgi:hypothetical protein
MDDNNQVKDVSTEEPVQVNSAERPVTSRVTFWLLLIVVIMLIVGIAWSLTLMLEDSTASVDEDTVEETDEYREYQDEFSFEEDEIFYDDVEVSYVSWDVLDIPEIFPEYVDGDIADTGVDTWQSGESNFYFIYNSSVEAIEYYVQSAVENGWKLVWEREDLYNDGSLSWAVDIEDAGTSYFITLDWVEGSEYLNLQLGERVNNVE